MLTAQLPRIYELYRWSTDAQAASMADRRVRNTVSPSSCHVNVGIFGPVMVVDNARPNTRVVDIPQRNERC